MFCFAASRTRLLMLLVISISLMSNVSANAFLKTKASTHEERISEEDIQTSLLAEVEGSIGTGAASSRLKQMESSLAPMFAALPKNEHSSLGHATVRYALHRLFVQRHGWYIQGLHGSGHRNSTSGVGLLKEQAPAYIQDLFEKRLHGKGLGLHELAVLAATIEHLVHSETIKRLGDALKIHEYLPTDSIIEDEADDVLDTYMMSYVLGEDLSTMTYELAVDAKKEMPEIYMSWNATQEFVRKVRKQIMQADSSTEQKSKEAIDFALLARVAERIGEQFGTFQDKECKGMKAALSAIEDSGTGRVRLSEFWKAALKDPNGSWQFGESLGYLRELGVLDETNPQNLRVIIPNYVGSPSNCIASSSFYSVCCMDECEGLLGHLESEIAAPEASPNRIAALVLKMSSSSVAAPRELSPTLLMRLDEMAEIHGGSVQLHGRLFAQWMHHAFPQECPYPHLAGTINPQTPDEWLDSTGADTTASEEEMMHEIINQANKAKVNQVEEVADSLPWCTAEELLVERPKIQGGSSIPRLLCNIALSASVLMIAYRMLRASQLTPAEKHAHFV